MGDRILVTGPSRSGKSEWAEQQAIATQQPVIYVATALANPADAEWQQRIERHRQRRCAQWQTREVPIHLAAALQTATSAECWLVDALGTWVANSLEQSASDWDLSVAELLEVVAAFPGTLILVAEETGWGVVPAFPAGRLFRDRLGRLTRQVGQVCDQVYLAVAGYAVDVRAIGQLIPPLDTPPED